MFTTAFTQSVRRLRLAGIAALAGGLFAVADATALGSLSAPAVVITGGQTAQVPISITNSPAADGVTGVDIFLRYDGDLFSADAVVQTAGTALATWTVVTNVVQNVSGTLDELRISAANSLPLNEPGTGVLFNVVFAPIVVTTPTSAALTFEVAELNEAAVATTAGSIAIGGDTGDLTLTAAAAPFIPGVAVDIELVDLDLAGTGSATVGPAKFDVR